jgi:predicted Zn finger-like uncharacterized protein
MSTIDAECPECAETFPIEAGQLGTEVKCPKCKFLFTATQSEGAYELADGPLSPQDDGPSPRLPRPGRPDRRPASTPRPAPKSETRAERELRERMEKWADDIENT